MERPFSYLTEIAFVGCLFMTGVQGVAAAQVVRGPYLQIKTPSNVIVRRRTDIPTDSRVQFGISATNL